MKHSEQQNQDSKTTDFGYEQVPIDEKVNKVGQVFSSVAQKYDVMNDLMSLGIHRLWKKVAIELSSAKAGQRILDVAGGTGDLTKKFAKIVGPTGHVILLDINYEMLTAGRDRLLNQGIVDNVSLCLGNAEQLPFPDNYFDVITIGFGLRNVTDKTAALRSMQRILKPGGRLLILEFSKPVLPGLKPIYDHYSFKILPFLGKWVANDADSYRYLAESIRMHPEQSVLRNMMLEAGFADAEYFNLTGGIVAIHRGYKK